MELRILYEDNHLIAVEKPVNIPVQQDDSKDKDLLTMVREYIKVKYEKPGNVYLGLVHRLDRPVGGVIVLAKTSKAASRMANLLRKREIARTYITVVRGKVVTKEGRLIHYLKKDRRQNIVQSVSKKVSGAKKAILDYKTIDKYNDLSLLQVKLETGRSHQIRVQMKELGYPIYGDQKYGAFVNKVGQQIALWSTRISFEHPVQKKEIMIDSQPPKQYPWNQFL